MPMKFTTSVVSSSHFIKLVFHRQSKNIISFIYEKKTCSRCSQRFNLPMSTEHFVFSLSLILLVERICFNIKTFSPLLVNSFILITCMLD